MIGVCIKYFHENYGGMLQAFATTKLLEKYKLDYELIQYKKRKTLGFMLRSIPRLFNNVLINDKYEALQKKVSFLCNPDFGYNHRIRMAAFKRFRDKHFTRLSEVYYGYDSLCKGAEKYSAVITGSDQLWSPAGLATNYYNLQFVPDHIRKISYASSFGVKHIPFYQRKRTAAFLQRIEYISMRENRGSEIVQELTGKDAITVLDPVFMFDSSEWDELIPYIDEVKEPYIFAYFLGKNPKHRQAVKELSQKTGCQIVTLRHLDQYVKEDEQFGHYAPYDVDPESFLNLLRGATYICTDSFHGSVFSIIYNKQFIVFNRYDENSKHSKNSRIDTICNNLGLEERRFNGQLYEEMIKQINYENVNKKLQVLKQASKQYLDSALGKEASNANNRRYVG